MSWRRGGEAVPAEESQFSMQLFHTTFESRLEVDTSECMGTTELVTCELTYENAVGREVNIRKDASICGGCPVVLHPTHFPSVAEHM